MNEKIWMIIYTTQDGEDDQTTYVEARDIDIAFTKLSNRLGDMLADIVDYEECDINDLADARKRIIHIENRIADIEFSLKQMRKLGCDLFDEVDAQVELMALRDELNFAWQDDEKDCEMMADSYNEYDFAQGVI